MCLRIYQGAHAVPQGRIIAVNADRLAVELQGQLGSCILLRQQVSFIPQDHKPHLAHCVGGVVAEVSCLRDGFLLKQLIQQSLQCPDSIHRWLFAV